MLALPSTKKKRKLQRYWKTYFKTYLENIFYFTPFHLCLPVFILFLQKVQNPHVPELFSYNSLNTKHSRQISQTVIPGSLKETRCADSQLVSGQSLSRKVPSYKSQIVSCQNLPQKKCVPNKVSRQSLSKKL